LNVVSRGVRLRVGIDFDNTIVGYDALFHRAAVDQGLVPGELSATKVAVRDYLRSIGREDDWTELQGYVYGPRMGEATPFPGVLDFFRWAREQRLELAIVSHRTRHPFIGPKHDLHEAARGWVDIFLRRPGLIDHDGVFFQFTKEEKLARIGAVGCTHFVDDLPEILLAGGFPQGTAPILFDPERHHDSKDRLLALDSWAALQRHFESVWAPTH